MHNFDLLSLKHIGNAFVQGICITDKNGIIQYVNEINERLFSIPSKNAVGHSIAEFTTGLEQVIHNASSLKGLENCEIYHSICTIKATQKNTMQYTAPIRNENGEVEGFLITDQDISKFLNIKKVLEESDNKMLSDSGLGQPDYCNFSNSLLPCETTVPLYSKNPLYKQAVYAATQAAYSDISVLLLGETGCGKEMFANYIQRQSDRCNMPFIKLNCSALPKDLLESELFGYEKGSFTGANTSGKTGYFELANHGVLFLDEIGELPLDFQVKLLRVLQERQITKIGGTKTIDLDIKLIFATNRDLHQMVSEGTFRQDLFYRINIFPIRIPPLREHLEDLPDLVHLFLDKFNNKYKKHVSLAPSVYREFRSYSWPGNIRELQNILERWVVIHSEFAVIEWYQVESHFFPNSANTYMPMTNQAPKNKSYKEMMDEYSREILLWAKDKYKTSREIAKALLLDHSTVCKKAKALGIDMKSHRPSEHTGA